MIPPEINSVPPLPEQLKNIFNAIPDPACLLYGEDGRYAYVNNSYVNVMGHPREAAIGRTPDELCIWHNEGDGHRLRKLILENGRFLKEQIYFRDASGEERVGLCSAETIELDGVRYVFSVTTDITGLKENEDDLRFREASFRALIENASDIITILDVDGTIRYESPSIEHLLGYQPADLVGQNSFTYVHPDDQAHVVSSFQDFNATGVMSVPLEFRFKHMDGTWRILEAIANKPPDDSAIEGIIVNSRDITERKLVEQALNESVEQFRSAQKMEAVGRLAGGVAHDFNNLLTAITGYSFMIINGLGPHHPLIQKAEEIKYAAERAASLTRQLLAFSRRQVLQPKVLDLNTIVSEVEKLLRRLIGEDIALNTHLAPELASVKADPGQIEQVILNLAINARDAMPAGGNLTIETANVELDEAYTYWHVNIVPGSYVRLSVSDSGTGMDAETQAHIFEPFFTTKERGKGSGLGLSTVYGIVKQSGGHVYVYSEIGLGTTFKIYLPQVSAAAKPVTAKAFDKELPRGSENILLVEDEEVVRKMSREILLMNGYQVIEARHGAEALEVAANHTAPIDLMLSDVVMPQMSGRELAERLSPLRPEMKILFMSGYTDDAIVHHGVLDEGMPFLQKPFTPDALARKVRGVLDGEKE